MMGTPEMIEGGGGGMNMMKRPCGAISEIEEEPSSDSELFELKLKLNNTTATAFPLDSITEEEASVFSLDFQHSPNGRDGDGEDVVYVAINAKSTEESSSSSMDALVWTLTHHPTALVFLVHVFPETKFIPMPCILCYYFHSPSITSPCFSFQFI